MKRLFNKSPMILAGLLLVLIAGLSLGAGGPVRVRPSDKSARVSRRQALDRRPRPAVVRVGAARPSITDRVLVRFRPGIAAVYAEGLLKSYGFPSVRPVQKTGFYSVRTAPGVSVEETLAMLGRNGDIEQARPDYRTRLAEVPNDEYFSNYQWNLRNRGGVLDLGGFSFTMTAGADIKAVTAWDETKGASEVVIAVLDTGVDLAHPDLAAKIVSPGHDFANDDDNATDDHWHGTHVAGIAAAGTGNSVGIAGVAWNCKILPVKIADSSGSGYDSWLIEGIYWAADQGADVINISFGGTFDEPLVEQACRYAYDKGIVVVAAAGNHSVVTDPTDVWYPAAYDSYVLAVAATDADDAVAGFSNYGPEVDVAAPGVWVLSSVPLWLFGTGGVPYAFVEGTSMAAPHVAGMAALIKSLKPDLGISQIMDVIRYTADDINRTTLPGRDDFAGYGRINMTRALAPYILK